MAIRTALYAGRRQANSSLLSAYSFRPTARILSSFHGLNSYPHQKPKNAGFGYSIRAVHGATVKPVTQRIKGDEAENNSENWKIKMLYDGDCPLCMREVNMLKEKNKQYGTIKFVDISSDDYSPEDNQGLDYKTAMGKIHAILSDGTVVTDVEVFRKLYEAVGLGWVYAITKYEPVSSIANAVYGAWAKYRLQITGRPPLEEVMELRSKKKAETCNDKNTCKM